MRPAPDDTDSPTYALTAAIGQCDGCDACVFDPLYAVVDGDALNTIFARPPDASGGEVGPRVSIDTDRCTVSIDRRAGVSIRPLSSDGGREGATVDASLPTAESAGD